MKRFLFTRNLRNHLILFIQFTMKRYLLTLALGCFILGANAKSISPDEALSRLNNSGHKVSALRGKNVTKLVHTATTQSGTPAVYVFNKESKGYLLLSADDMAYPLLGYSDSGSFSAENMPPQLKWWIEEYARQIEYASSHAAKETSTALHSVTRANREAIAPMIKTKWDQGVPYNNSAPKYGAERTFTGCVATAMAQVMNYWKYPEIGQGSISYNSESLGKRLTLNFANRKFDWEHMADTYSEGLYTQEEADAVAYLMKAAGFAVRMDYAQDSSGALAMNISKALTKYFNYDGNIKYDLRLYHSASEWEQMIYDNLKNVGPILYGGGSYLGGGHSFICDGYDGNGLFHFNWGWSGMSDGYFSLDALSPNSLGAGGGAGGGYNFTQDAVFGIQPPTGKPVVENPIFMTQMGSLQGSIEGDFLYLNLIGEESAGWVNYFPETQYVRFEAVIEPQNGSAKKITVPLLNPNEGITDFSLQAGYSVVSKNFNPHFKLSSLNLENGTYKISVATRNTKDENAPLVDTKGTHGRYTSFLLKKTGEIYSTVNEYPEELTLLNVSLTRDLYFAGVASVKIEVENETDVELSQGFAPILFTADRSPEKYAPIFLGESIFVTVPPKSKVTREWTTDLMALQQNLNITEDTDVDLGIFDETTYNFYLAEKPQLVTMHANPGRPEMVTRGFPTIEGKKVTENVDGKETSVTVITDPLNINVTSRITLQNGICAYNVYAAIITNLETGELGTYSGYPVFIDKKGLSHSFSTTLSFPQAKPGVYYPVAMAYTWGQYFVPIGNMLSYFRLDSSAVDEIEAEEETGDGTIFNLQGMPLGKDLETLPAGLYIRNGKKIIKK